MEDKKRQVEVMTANIENEEGAIVQATHGSPDHPLKIGDLEIPCYVLEDGKRVVVLSGMLKALDMAYGTAGRRAGNRLAKFIQGKTLGPFISDHLLHKIIRPLKFRATSGALAYGYEATVLADLCEAILQARDSGLLQKQQAHIANRCEILIRGFARVGIIALVDEATGFQEFRARQALEEILRKFISDELLKWVKMFPDEFYRQMFRLQRWNYSEFSSKRPLVAGRITNDVVYERLAPGVLDELRRITPKDTRGRRKHKYHQRLTEDVGHPRLREHLASVITLMRASSNWRIFYSMLNRALPKLNTTLPMLMELEDEERD